MFCSIFFIVVNPSDGSVKLVTADQAYIFMFEPDLSGCFQVLFKVMGMLQRLDFSELCIFLAEVRMSVSR
jgi:hypothetical protein